MKILILSPYLETGGLERVALNLCEELIREGRYQPEVYVFESDTGSLAGEFEKRGIPVLFRSKGRGFSLRSAWRIRSHALAIRAPIIHTQDMGALIYGVLAKWLSGGKLRVVHTQHSFVHLSFRKRYRFYERFFTRFADEVCVVSPDTIERYRQLGIPVDRILLIPNGCPFPPDAPTRDVQAERARLLESLPVGELRSRLNHLRDRRWILYLARVTRQKGQLQSLEIWKNLPDETRKNSALIFVGQDSERGTVPLLLERAKTLPDAEGVVYSGSTLEPGSWLKASDLFLSASEFEGMPISPLEGISHELPVVLSDIAGHRIFERHASLFPIGNAAAAAQLIQRWMERIAAHEPGLRQELAEAKRAYRELYSAEAMTRRYSEAYARALARRSG